MKKSVFVFCLGLFLATTCSAQDPIFEFADFSSTNGLTVNEDAMSNVDNGIDASPVLRLVSSLNENGSVFTNNQVDIQDFRTDFCFRLTDSLPFAAADGFTFTIHADPDGAAAGEGQGGFMGFKDIDNSVTVQFDISNQFEDDSDNHVGINFNGSPGNELNETAVSPKFDNGDLWCAWIVYENGILDVYVDNSTSRPAVPVISQAVDIPAIVGQNTAHVGFTAATGNGAINHDITRWTFRPPAAIPTMGQWALFLFGLMILTLGSVGVWNVKRVSSV